MLPIISQKQFAEYCDRSERIREASSDEQKRKIVQEAKAYLRNLTSQPGIPAVLRGNVSVLLDGITARDGEWIANCLDCISLPKELPSLDEKRSELFSNSVDVLQNLVADVRVIADSDLSVVVAETCEHTDVCKTAYHLTSGQG